MLFRRSHVLPVAVCLAPLLFLCQPSFSQDNRIVVDAGQTMNRIPSTIYGTCIEDVNHEIYGGFYAQQLFGESFEEPSSGANYKDWRKYTGYWAAETAYSDGGLTLIPGRGTKRYIGKIDIGVEPDDHARLVYDPLTISNGTVSFALRMPEPDGTSAGVLLRVSRAGTGENSLRGYGVSLSRNGKWLLLTKHNNNYTLLAQADVAVNPAAWNSIRVRLEGALIQVFLGDDSQPLISYEDKQAPYLSGKIGLTTARTAVAFRQVQLTDDNKTISLPLVNEPHQQVSDHWDMIRDNDVQAAFTLSQDNAYNGVTAQQITLSEGKGRAGIANRGLNHWGIAVQKGQRLNGAVWLRTERGPVNVTVALEDLRGTKTYASQIIPLKEKDWTRFDFPLTANAADSNARFALYISEKGRIAVDQVSLFPTGEQLFKGLPLRADIGNAIVGEQITFIRYAGSMVNAEGYRFKKMIGPRDQRPPYTGHWNKYSTNGFGIEEFLQFCEAAHLPAAFAINIEETAQDMSDMVEYLNGATSSTWGKKRADNGHPAPYNVKYIEIGNEEGIFRGDNKEDYDHYIERFNALYTAIHSKDPGIKLIQAAWWRPESKHMETVFRALNGKADYWDFHPWADGKDAGLDIDKELTRMEALFRKWDPHTSMKCVIFEENGALHNMQRALGHATTLNAVRKHGDFLLTSCPANALQPYHQNDNGWDQGQIFFTPTSVWGMPPYYAQRMAALNHLPLRVKETVTGGLNVTATISEQKDTLVLHVVNTADQPAATTLELNNFGKRNGRMDTWMLAAPLAAENLPEKPDQVNVQQSAITLPAAPGIQYTFPAYSYTILRLTTKTRK